MSDDARRHLRSPLPRCLEPGHEPGQRLRGRTARQHRLDKLKAAARRDSALERHSKLLARLYTDTIAAKHTRQLREVPVVQIVEARLRLEYTQHFPTRVVEDDHDRVPAIAAAVAQLEARHLKRAVAHQDHRAFA